MRGEKRPTLASGKLPFTPIAHKQAAEFDPPYHPLQVEDLEIPKRKHMNASSPDINPQHRPIVEGRAEFVIDDAQELKRALLLSLDMVARLQKERESKVYCSIGTQATSNQDERVPLRPRAVSPSKSRGHEGQTKGKPRKPFAPRLASGGSPEKGSSDENLRSGRGAQSPALHKRIHEMSLLLRRLESQLDGINAPG
jgi:hypothetical protein